MDDTELITLATEIHNREGCNCDHRYLMSCTRMANAILRAGTEIRRRSTVKGHHIHAGNTYRLYDNDGAIRCEWHTCPYNIYNAQIGDYPDVE
jgi:hypothetical protein